MRVWPQAKKPANSASTSCPSFPSPSGPQSASMSMVACVRASPPVRLCRHYGDARGAGEDEGSKNAHIPLFRVLLDGRGDRLYRLHSHLLLHVRKLHGNRSSNGTGEGQRPIKSTGGMLRSNATPASSSRCRGVPLEGGSSSPHADRHRPSLPRARPSA